MSNVLFLLGQGYEGGGKIIILSFQGSGLESYESPRQLGLSWWWPHPGLSLWSQGCREHSQPLGVAWPLCHLFPSRGYTRDQAQLRGGTKPKWN